MLMLDIFDDANTFVSYDGSQVTAVFYNPDSAAGGTFEEHNFPIDYLMTIDMDNVVDLADYLFSDAYHCPTYCSDWGTDPFICMYYDLIRNDKWVPFTDMKGVEGFILGVLAVVKESIHG